MIYLFYIPNKFVFHQFNSSIYCLYLKSDEAINTSHYWEGTHIVSTLERLLHGLVHVVVVERHEQRVDDDTKRDEEFDERVEDYERNVLLELEPEPATVPHAEDVDASQKVGHQLLLHRGAVLVLFCREIVDGYCACRRSNAHHTTDISLLKVPVKTGYFISDCVLL